MHLCLMKHVSILVPETAIAAAIVDPRYMFTAVNEFFKTAGHEPFFKVQLVGMTREVIISDGLITIHPDLLFGEVAKTDLIIIPALSGNMEAALQQNTAFLPWIINQYKNGAEVASLCVGAFLLASTGLLKGKSCSTHWLFSNDFRNKFPDVHLEHEKIITAQNGLYTSGGASSYWNLLLYLVEKYTTREMAIMASKFFLLDVGRDSQSQFMMFKGQKDHEDPEILKAQEFIECNYGSKLSVEDLADQVGVARRTFERRFKKATANTVIEYIQRVKIEIAKKYLETGRKTVNEVMYDVGYTDVKAFREVFKKVTGMSPVEYRNKYN
jgi:transcriptional regulator GlxA family with amidase domain